MKGLRKTLVLLLSPCLLSGVQALAADSVVVPAYAPETGVEYLYRSHRTTSTDMSLWFDRPAAIMRGDFRQRMTVLSRDAEGMRVRWSLSADLPQDAEGAADTYAMNALYRNTLSAYGVRCAFPNKGTSARMFFLVHLSVRVRNCYLFQPHQRIYFIAICILS